MVAAAWETEAQKCREILAKSIPAGYALADDRIPSPEEKSNVTTFIADCGALSPKELAITENGAGELTAAMAMGKYTAEEVTVAFLKRAVIGHQLVNFATEFLATEAIEKARELDKYFQDTGKLVGPLHGVPISVKEHIGLEGRICHSSYTAWVKNVAAEDALIVALMKKAGAVILFRTNQPQTLMHGDTNNNIYGKTVNPSNRLMSSGGSSGGEGAAIKLRCAAIGTGTDIAGSIRIPSALCGVYGFRPTSCRLPYKGIMLAGGGQESVRCVVGPLANNIDDLELMMRTVLDQSPYEVETSLVPLPWRPERALTPQTLSVGVMVDDGIVRPSPPLRRAMEMAQEKLKATGVRLVPWIGHRHDELRPLLYELCFSDNASVQKGLLAETQEPWLKLTKRAMGLGREMDIHEIWRLHELRNTIREEYHAKMKQLGIDVILSPAVNQVAVLTEDFTYGFYTGLYNILDFPAAVFPTKLVSDAHLDVEDPNAQPRNDFEARELAKYDAELFAGMPIALEVAGKHHRDEETLAAMRLIEQVVLA
ncbi:hypothetical protein AYO21_09680 [Fonsecaea monophora]|uniref:Amidase domain-containing protein n=1 Tax=Fonsecaea monophora TaxID=254056 RepID=A0A177EXY5_9EURO|nr:hypothetical protein AYO21_09680 [Fonsecaea monophora]OAG36140.1 hypothetical protein AYO21_09680 [Fonsecaea monophora]